VSSRTRGGKERFWYLLVAAAAYSVARFLGQTGKLQILCERLLESLIDERFSRFFSYCTLTEELSVWIADVS
jgi:hypothetical protein